MKRLWSRTERVGDCLIWKGAKTWNGYGRLSINNEAKLAHRVAWELSNQQEIPDGMVICHSCDTRDCINPEHLFLGTYKDNMEDMVSKGRKASKKGERNGRSKLTENDVSDIRLLLCFGMRQSDVAKEYHVTRATICDIKHNRLWMD